VKSCLEFRKFIFVSFVSHTTSFAFVLGFAITVSKILVAQYIQKKQQLAPLHWGQINI